MSIETFTGNCLNVMNGFDAESIDMVLCDLPYGQTQNAWDKIIDIPALWKQLRRVTKRDGAMVLMAAQPFAARLIASNEIDFRYDLIWRKNKPTGFLNANRQPLRIHEHILVFYRAQPFYEAQKTQGHDPVHAAVQTSHGKNYGAKTQRIVSGGSTERFPTSVLDVPIINNDDPDKVHPTQKPVALMEWLIRSYTRPGETVLDCTMGSGTTGVACHNTGRNFVGIEIDPEYVAAAERRILEASQLLAVG